MTVVGLTGNIGSGKSTVADWLRGLGARVIDTDQVARDVVAPGTSTLKQITDEFGPNILNRDGTLSRPQLAQIVFTDPKARTRLNDIIHPAILQVIEREIALYKQNATTPLLVIEAPLLIETGLHQMVDEVWLVTIDEQKQIQRAARRDQVSTKQIKHRLAAQMPQQDKIPYAHRIIDNNNRPEQTKQQVQQIWQQFCPTLE